MRSEARLYKREGSTLWYAYFRSRGKTFRQSTGETDEKAAQKFLDGKLDEVAADRIGARKFVTPNMERLTLRDLLDRLEVKYQDCGQYSDQNKSVIERAKADFGHFRAVGLDAVVFDKYKRTRLGGEKPAKLATVQRIFQVIRAAYLRAVKHDKFPAHEVPFIEIVKECNVRTDYYREAEFRAILPHLPKYLSDFALFAARTGMRFSEITSLRWSNVEGDTIKLAGADAKGDGSEKFARYIPMAGKDLSEVFTRRTAARRVRRHGRVELAEHIFHHNGKPIVDIRKAWRSAITKAGLRHLVFHTLRNTAVHMMDDSGISRDAAMAITGHKTQAMFSRYNYSDVQRARTALERSQEFAARLDVPAQQPANVTAMQR